MSDFLINPFAFGGLEVKSAAVTFTTSSSVSATMPSGVADGDRLLMFVHTHASTGSVAAASGWSNIANAEDGGAKGEASVLTKVASGEGGTVSVTGLTGSGESKSVTIVRCSPATVDTQAAATHFSATPAPAPSVSPSVPALVVGWVSVNSATNGSTYTPVAGTTEHLDSGAAGDSVDLYVEVFSYLAAAGATGTKTPTFSGTGSGYGTAQVALI